MQYISRCMSFPFYMKSDKIDLYLLKIMQNKEVQNNEYYSF